MSIPTNREEFKQYCLRKLGAPVIKINVADEQVEDRVTEALNYFAEHSYAGTQHVYIGVQLTQQDINNGYVMLPDNVTAVVRLLSATSGSFSQNPLFNLERDFVMQNWGSYRSGNMTSYYLMRLSLETVRELMVAKPMIRFNRLAGAKVYLDISKDLLTPDQFLVFECYAVIDGDEYPDLWSNRWLQNYTAALIKEQWGQILTKFQNVQLFGGVQFTGDMILQQAIEERRALEEEMLTSYSPLPMHFYG